MSKSKEQEKKEFFQDYKKIKIIMESLIDSKKNSIEATEDQKLVECHNKLQLLDDKFENNIRFISMSKETQNTIRKIIENTKAMLTSLKKRKAEAPLEQAARRQRSVDRKVRQNNRKIRQENLEKKQAELMKNIKQIRQKNEYANKKMSKIKEPSLSKKSKPKDSGRQISGQPSKPSFIGWLQQWFGCLQPAKPIQLKRKLQNGYQLVQSDQRSSYDQWANRPNRDETQTNQTNQMLKEKHKEQKMKSE